MQLAGTTVARASLHNQDHLERLDVRIFDRVGVEKAGDIIPQVVAVDKAARTGKEKVFRLPDHCPSCGQPVVKKEGEAAIRCVNSLCPAQVQGTVLHFSRRFAMDIDHLGESLIAQLIEAGLIESVADLYTLTQEQLLVLDRIGKKSADNILAAISASRSQPFDRLVTGLGIDLIGQVAARQFAEKFVDLSNTLQQSPEDFAHKCEEIPGFGPKMVESIRDYFADPKQRALLVRLQELGVSTPLVAKETAQQGPLLGLSFCVTGVLSKKREDVHADIRGAGGTVHDKVKKGTTYLVAGEKVGQSKLTAAAKAGTKVISEAELAALIESGPSLDPPQEN